MVDSNIQQENRLPSERVRAFKTYIEAVKRKEEKDNSPNILANYRSDDAVSEKAGISGDTAHIYIFLTRLVPKLMQMMDNKKIPLPCLSNRITVPREPAAACVNHRLSIYFRENNCEVVFDFRTY